MPKYKTVTVHDFKANLSSYLRGLDRGDYDALFVRRYKRRVAMILSTARMDAEAKEKKRAQAERAAMLSSSLAALGALPALSAPPNPDQQTPC